MTVLITGVAGFIGSRFAKHLIDKGINVIGIDDLSGGYLENIPSGISFHQWSCHDILSYVFERYKIDIVYHFAAYASEGRSNNIRRFIHENNTIGTANIINYCINYHCKLVFASSVAVYSGTPPFNEDTIPNPIDEYGLSKYMSERSIKIAGDFNNLEWCIIRPRNVYGVGQSIFDPSRNLFGILCYNALNNIPIRIFGDGSNTRSFTNINDILEPMYNCLSQRNTSFNIGSPMVYSIKKAVDIFCEISGYLNVEYTTPRHEVKHAYCSIDKSENILGYKDATSLKTGLTEMWEWAKTLPKKEFVKVPPIEVNHNVHPSLL